MTGNDIYTRVNELISDIYTRMTDRDLFGADLYQSYLKKKAINILTGAVFHLNELGFRVDSETEKKMISNLSVSSIYEPNDPLTASAQSNQQGEFNVMVNTGCTLLDNSLNRAERHYAILGLLYHEMGHLLFSDFPTHSAWISQMQKGMWFPTNPTGLSSTTGINLGLALVSDEEYRKVICICAHYIYNAIEDGYIERELAEMCPARGSQCLNTINTLLIETFLPLDEALQSVERTVFQALLSQILYYSKFGEYELGGYTGELTGVLFDVIDILDDVAMVRDPQVRLSGVNEILCILFPYLDADIKALQQSLQNSGRNKSNQQGNSGSLSPDVADIMQSIIEIVAKQSGASSDNPNCQSSALNNPANNKNRNAPAKQDNTGNGTTSSSGGASNKGAADLDAADLELNELKDDIATAAAQEQVEIERTEDLNQAGNSYDYGDIILGNAPVVTVTRAAAVSETNRAEYERLQDNFLGISRDLQRGIKALLKDKKEGGKLKNLPFGKRLEVMSIPHNDGKYFSRNKIPSECQTLGVGLLVDESGSTTGTLIESAVMACIIVENFCREMKIPHIINGYTSNIDSGASILSYAEPHEVDDANRYRITGMHSRGGTPTATALTYMINRLREIPTDYKILIVITDGQSGDNRELEEGTIISNLIEAAKKNRICVSAAGIGSERKQVEAEFHGYFIDITHLNNMPEQLIEIIKKNMYL